MSNDEQKHAHPEETYRSRAAGTKERAQRIAVDYQRRPRLLRWLRLASVAGPIVVTLAAIPFLGRGREKAFERAQLSRAHAVFENNCASCHVTKFAKVSDSN